MVLPEHIEKWLVAGLPGAQVTVIGDGQHFEALIIYDGFANKTMLQQHRMVYTALGDKMQHTIHALSMKTYTIAQAKQANIIINKEVSDDC